MQYFCPICKELTHTYAWTHACTHTIHTRANYLVQNQAARPREAPRCTAVQRKARGAVLQACMFRVCWHVLNSLSKAAMSGGPYVHLFGYCKGIRCVTRQHQVHDKTAMCSRWSSFVDCIPACALHCTPTHTHKHTHTYARNKSHIQGACGLERHAHTHTHTQTQSHTRGMRAEKVHNRQLKAAGSCCPKSASATQ